MALGFGATLFDGYTIKIFTVTALDNDAADNLVVPLDGPLTGNPTAFGLDGAGVQMVPRVVGCVRVDNGAAGPPQQQGAESEFAVHTVDYNTCTVRKLTASGAGANTVTVQVTLEVPHSLVQ
jgi:hypothetical protein